MRNSQFGNNCLIVSELVPGAMTFGEGFDQFQDNPATAEPTLEPEDIDQLDSLTASTLPCWVQPAGVDMVIAERLNR